MSKSAKPLAALILTLTASGLCLAQTKERSNPEAGVHTPGPGSPERQAIMDVMRLDFYRNDPNAAHRNSEGVFFKVLFLKAHGDWALSKVQPVNAAGEEHLGDWRWELLRRKAGQWSNANYLDALGPYASDEAVDDALDMTASTIRKLWRRFPGAPKDIFPDLDKQPKSLIIEK